MGQKAWSKNPLFGTKSDTVTLQHDYFIYFFLIVSCTPSDKFDFDTNNN